MLVPTLIALAILGAIVAYLLRSKSHPTPAPAPVVTAPAVKKPAKVDITKKTPGASLTARKTSEADTHGDHPLVYRHLRGHQGDITGVAVSTDGHLIASVSKDESLRVWSVVEGQPNTQFARVNLQKGYYASAVDLSGQYVVIAVAEMRQVQIYGVKEDKKAENKVCTLTSLHQFPTPHKANITTIKMASNHQSIITMAEGSTDLNMHVFSAKGAILATLNVNQIVNYSFALSSDARFIAAGTKISDTKVWEMMYKKDSKSSSSTPSSGAPDKVELAMTLKAHKRGVRSIAFGSPSSGRVVSAAIDGAFAEHSLNVRYAAREEPKLKYRIQTEFETLSLIDLTHPADEDIEPTIAVASGPTLQFWRASQVGEQPEPIVTIPAPHKQNITSLTFTKGPKPFLVTAGENKSITIWNVPK